MTEGKNVLPTSDAVQVVHSLLKRGECPSALPLYPSITRTKQTMNECLCWYWVFGAGAGAGVWRLAALSGG